MPDIEIKRGYEVLPDNNVRFGIRITNTNDVALSEVEVILDYAESLFNLEGERVQKLGIIPPASTRTAEFILKPLGCVHQVNIEATIFYKDPMWEKHIETMRPKKVHCVCPFLRGKKIPKAEFLNLLNTGHSAETGLNFRGVSVEQLTSFLVQTCRNRHYKVDDLSIDGGRMLYLASESIGEKAYYLLTALIKEDGGLTQVLLKAVSDKPYGLTGFLNETVAELRHVVDTVQTAQEIGIIKKEQVINIIDSVVQRTSFGGGEGAASVTIEGSMVTHTDFNKDEMEKEQGRLKKQKEEERKRKEEQERLRREEAEKKKNDHIPNQEPPTTAREEKKGTSKNKILAGALILGGLLVILLMLGSLAVTPTATDAPEISKSTSAPTPEVTPTSAPAHEVTPTPAPTLEVTPTPAPTPAVTPTPEPKTWTIRLENFLSRPSILEINKGDTVVWMNFNDPVKQFTLVSKDGLWEDKTIVYRLTFVYTFEKSGTYNYTVLGFDPRMSGSVIVK